MLEELEVSLNDTADEVYLAMRRNYSSVLDGGDVPQHGKILPKMQRLFAAQLGDHLARSRRYVDS